MEIKKDDWNELVDIIQDLSTSISMHVENHGTKSINDAIMRIACKVSEGLAKLEKKID